MSAAGVIASGLFNAVSFSAASFIFSKLSHKNDSEEMKRHNIAVEKLTKAKSKWYEKDVACKDHIAKHKELLVQANQDINMTQLKQYEDTVNPELQFSDSYQPSEEMKHYQTFAVGALGHASGVGLTKVVGLMLT